MPMAKQQIYYRSNQGFRLKLTDANGEPLTLEDNDWKAKLYNTTSSDHLELSHSQDGGWVNCAPVPDAPGALYVDMANSTLLPGALKLAIEFADGAKCKFDLDVELTPYPVKNIEAAVEATLPIMQTSLKPLEDEIKRLRNSLKMATAGPKVLQRGLISIHAQPGVVYRNLGYIKIPVKYQRDENNQLIASVYADLNCVDIHGLNLESPEFISQNFKQFGSSIGYTYNPVTKILKGQVNLSTWESQFPNDDYTAHMAVSFRLVIPKSPYRPYLCKMPNGKICALNASVINTQPEPPVLVPINNIQAAEIIKNEKTGVDQMRALVYASFPNAGVLDIEILRRSQFNRPSTRNRDPDSAEWDRVVVRGYRWVKLEKLKTHRNCGILRVRVTAGRRRPPSDWVVCKFNLKGMYPHPISHIKIRT